MSVQSCAGARLRRVSASLDPRSPTNAHSRDRARRAGASVAALPGEDDEVIEEQGARLFLDREASSLLEDKILDANVGQNQVEFTLAEQ